MPISDRLRIGALRGAPVLLAFSLLAGCDETTANAFAAGGSAPRARVLTSAKIDGGKITVLGPAGFCVDARSLRPNGARQFALLAQCDLMTGGEVSGVNSLSLLTVTAVRSSDTVLPTPDQIAAPYAPAQVLNSARIDGVQLVQLSQGGERATKSADPVHWRGVMTLAGHTIGLAAYSTQNGAARGAEGRDLLLALARNMRRATTGTGTGDTPAVQAPTE
jgi:hypothetical protein